jgi:hypothetical protein
MNWLLVENGSYPVQKPDGWRRQKRDKTRAGIKPGLYWLRPQIVGGCAVVVSQLRHVSVNCDSCPAWPLTQLAAGPAHVARLRNA